MKTRNEIGSEFELSTSRGQNPAYPRGLQLYSGRDCLDFILRTVAADEALLPAYICPEILSPFKEHEVRVRFYPLNPDLSINPEKILRLIRPQTKILLVIHYFGFPQKNIKKLRSLCDQRGVILIEDCVQALLTTFGGKRLGNSGHFSIFGLRKWLPLPDGAILSVNMRIPPVQVKSRLACEIASSIRAFGMRLKYAYLHGMTVPKPLFRRLMSLAEAAISYLPKPSSITGISRRLMARQDLEGIAKKRRANYSRLLKIRSAHCRPLYNNLPAGVVPLGMPVICEDREGLRRWLIRNNIFPAWHWQLPDALDTRQFRECRKISSRILTLPVDQRYSEKDMERIMQVVNSYGNPNNI